MIGVLTSLAALLYCFVWLRPPELGGVALPVQRVIAWIGVSVVLSRLLLKGPVPAGPAARKFLGFVTVFALFLLLIFVRQLAYGDNFFPLYFMMDLSKFIAAFAMAYLCYYALTRRLIHEERFTTLVILSGVLATVLVFALLGLYYAGFRSESALIAPSFDGAVGIWPTEGLLPRLSGPTAEPQQLSVVLLTPLLLMLSPDRIRRLWPLAIITASALLLSQSKFSVISLSVVVLYLFIVYRRWRGAIVMAALSTAPVLILALFQLPTFSVTLERGRSAGAFVERLENLLLLVSIIKQHPFVGIGPGHYGVVWGQTLFGDWRYDPGYTPNMDFLKIFAETGVVGFLLILLLLGSLVRLFARSYRVVPVSARASYLAYFLGALAIILNMTIGYELLHVFFWINIGVLLYFVDRSRARTAQTGVTGHAYSLTAGPVSPI